MTFLRILIAMTLISTFLGCVSRPAKPSAPDMGLIQRVLNRAGLPSDFRGPATIEERGQYLVIVITAGDLHRNDAGEWTWSSLEYQRTLNIPLFAGVPYKHEGKVRLGAPAAKPPGE